MVGRPGLGSGQLSRGEVEGRGRAGSLVGLERRRGRALESQSLQSGWEVGFEILTESLLRVRPLSSG